MKDSTIDRSLLFLVSLLLYSNPSNVMAFTATKIPTQRCIPTPFLANIQINGRNGTQPRQSRFLSTLHPNRPTLPPLPSLPPTSTTSTTPTTHYQQLLSSSSTLSLAPMMEYTDRHFRTLVRLLSQRTLLYTEMVAANAVVHERSEAKLRAAGGSPPLDTRYTRNRSSLLQQQAETDVRELGYDATYLRRFLGQSGRVGHGAGEGVGEGPCVLQFGGSDPTVLSEASRTVMELTSRGYCDYTALNLNCGCPSPKVAGKGRFGAALMEEPRLVRDLVGGMHEGCGGALPITVKCRIGTDVGYGFTKSSYREMSDEDEYDRLRRFVETVADGGVVTDFQIHARIAVLDKKFTPAANRNVPPLKYGFVHRLVEEYPELTFTLNGGVETLGQVRERLEECPGMEGVMVGRGWVANPWGFAVVDDLLYGNNAVGKDGASLSTSSYPSKPKNRLEVLKTYGQHADWEETLWDPSTIRRFIIKAIQPLFAGEPNAKKYRIALDEIAGRPKKLAAMGGSVKDEPPLSELIMDVATECLSEEVLLRTAEETYDRMVMEQERRTGVDERPIISLGEGGGGGDCGGCGDGGTGTSGYGQMIKNWQTERKEEGVAKE